LRAKKRASLTSSSRIGPLKLSTNLINEAEPASAVVARIDPNEPETAVVQQELDALHPFGDVQAA
jgi:hypothetical protein